MSRRTVSYTHLDVYKRQPEGYASELKEAKMMKMGLCAEDAAVSYTHLDVYKRQEIGCEWRWIWDSDLMGRRWDMEAAAGRVAADQR